MITTEQKFGLPKISSEKKEEIILAKLKLEEQSNLVFLGLRQWTSGKGNLLTFAKLGDPTKFENHEFIIDTTKVVTNDIPLNSNVKPDFEMGLYNNRTSLNLVGLTAVK